MTSNLNPAPTVVPSPSTAKSTSKPTPAKVTSSSHTDHFKTDMSLLLFNSLNKDQDLHREFHRQIDKQVELAQYTKGAPYKELHEVETITAPGKSLKMTTTTCYYKWYLYIPENEPIPEENLGLYGLFTNNLQRQNSTRLKGFLNPLKIQLYHGKIDNKKEELDKDSLVDIELRPFAFVIQTGSLDDGHYRTYEPIKDNKLVRFDDSSASFTSKDSSVTTDIETNAYLVGYDIHLVRRQP